MRSSPTHRVPPTAGLAALFAVCLLLSSCSFDVAATGLECDREGAERPGEVCRDGYWRIVADADLDASGQADGTGTNGSDGSSDEDSSSDGCTSPDDQSLCEDRGIPCGEIPGQLRRL